MFNPTSQCDAGVARTHRFARKRLLAQLAAGLLAASPLAALPATDLSSDPLPTYSVGSAVDVKPNILMVLDDSGSMDWDYLPDWANDRPDNYYSLPDYLRRNATFNGVAYNPAVRYRPPVTFTSAGAKDTTTYPSMDGTSATAGGDATATAAAPNWKSVVYDGYGVQRDSSGNRPRTDLQAGAFFYTAVAGEYCDSPALSNCVTATAPTGNYQYAAPLRWCSNRALTTCRGLWTSTYKYMRIPAPRLSVVTFSSSSSAKVTSIKVGTAEIIPSETGSYSDSSNLAQAVVDKINACTLSVTGNCTTVGYFARRSGTSVRIYAPGAVSDTPVVTKTGTTTVSITSGDTGTAGGFARSRVPLPDWHDGDGQSTNPVPGENLMTVITASVNSYPYPGSTQKHAARTDCTTNDATTKTCTYKEEMTNYANWWAYYRTRMQMMKTSTSRAFSSLDSDADIAAGTTRYRVGYLTLNNNTNADFVNVKDFDGTQKFTWFTRMFQAIPNSGTPLRQALARAGRLYGGKYNGGTLNGVSVEDPMQFSCQKNYTILSTDGFWNGSAGTKLDGSTAVGNIDGAMPRPYNDGATQQAQQRTSKLRKRTVTQYAEKGTLQKRTLRIMRQTSQLQISTSNDSGSAGSWTAWADTNYCDPDNNGRDRTRCQYTAWSAYTAVGSCTGQGRDWNDPYTVGLAENCDTTVLNGWASAPLCTPGFDASTGVTTECRYNFASSAATQTCAPAYAAGDFTAAAVYRNCSQNTGNWGYATSCTTTPPAANGQYTECGYEAWSGWSNASSCTARAQSTGPNYTVDVARECTSNPAGGTSDTLADVAAYYYNTDLRNAAATGVDATGTCTGPIISPSTTPNDLCDNNVIAYGRDNNPAQHMTTHTLGLGVQGRMVYSQYQNNLTGQRTYYPDYWTQPSGDFYAVANGSIASPSTGICSWMNSGDTCTWSTPSADSTANIDDLWHAAVNGHGTYFSATDPQSLADALTNVLSQITHTPRPGTAAAAASSNPNITPADNYVFSSSYRSIDWFGELIMQQFEDNGELGPQQWSAMQMLDCATTPWRATRAMKKGEAFQQGGACYAVNEDYTSGATFDASGVDGQNTTQIPNATPNTRTVYTVGTTGLVPFEWASLTTTQQNYFKRPNIAYVSASQGLTQFCTTGATCLTDAAMTAAEGEAMVNFLRGDRTNESSYFRTRARVLGDIVASEARYVKQPQQKYLDPGYAEFKQDKVGRAATVYVGANDGMLHAFDALTGQERWAFVPTAVLPDMYRLADINYETKHRYFVDGTPEVGDICPSGPAACSRSDWKTIIVGGLNQGGKSYFALDITNPASPALLWEFTHADLGFTYSNPRITKLRDGRWVVIIASGYNNADGVGRLFVLNANTGALITTISTGTGDATNPSGLARISARSPSSETNNTVEQVYGGDLLGNVWRFDVNDSFGATGYDAHKLIILKDASGNTQPITVKPTVAQVGVNPLVIVGTGKYLGLTDLSSTTTNTVYGIQDKLSTTTLVSPRDLNNKFVQQTMTSGPCPDGTPITICSPTQTVRLGTSNAVDWGTKDGWYLDFMSAGERSVTDSVLALGTLAFTTIRPQALSASTLMGCDSEEQGVDAKSNLYYLNYLTGGAVEGTRGVIGEELCTCVSTRPSVVKTQGGKVQALTRTTGGGGGGGDGGTDMAHTDLQDLPYSGAGGPSRRISWRELNGE